MLSSQRVLSKPVQLLGDSQLEACSLLAWVGMTNIPHSGLYLFFGRFRLYPEDFWQHNFNLALITIRKKSPLVILNLGCGNVAPAYL